MGSRLEGKVAIVSGGARGIGAATVRAFVEQGASVVVGDVLTDQAVALAAELGSRCVATQLDVRDRDSWASAVDLANSTFGPVTVLVNNAGVNSLSPIDQLALDDFRRLFDVHVIGALLGIQAVSPGMKTHGIGSIVHVCSTTGLVGLAGNGAYAMSKAASTMLARTAALELGQFGIRVNSVHPGGVDTDMQRDLPIADQSTRDAWYGRLPISRVAQPEEVASAIVFLASDESSLSTGSQLLIDCGQLAGVARI
jgi:3alpha(or 20beta)-hydroxysteroid dehydrogenase